MARSPLTVGDALRLALPSGTRVAHGHEHLRHPISWVRAFVTRPYVIGAIEPDALVILSLRGLTARPEIRRLPRLVEALIAAQISGIVLTNESPEVTQTIARADSIPLLVLPPDALLPDAERAVIALILDRKSQVERRAAELYQQLIQLALLDVPVQAMADAFAQLAGRVIYLEDEYGALQAVAVPNSHQAPSLPAAGDAVSLYSAREVLGIPSSGPTPSISHDGPIWRLLADGVHEVCSAPISLGGAAAGFLTILGRAEDMEDVDEYLVTRAASAFAIPIARQRAVVETQTRLQGSFLEALFAGTLLHEEEIVERARHLGHNLREPYETACLTLDHPSSAPANAPESQRGTLWASFLETARRELLNQWPRVLVKDRGEALAVLLPSGERPASASLRPQAEQVRTRLSSLMGGMTATVGLGPRAAGPREILRSYGQAEQAARIGRHFLGGNQTVTFEELGAYRLLASIEDPKALAVFSEEYLGALEAYDARYNAELIDTLEGFFNANGNHARTAEGLHLHRNTLLYRLTRIEALTGRDLSDPETRLCLQLALKIRHLAPQPSGSPTR